MARCWIIWRQKEPHRMRWILLTVAAVLGVLWFGCWAVTVGTGSPAVAMQWCAGNGLALATGIAIGAAACLRHRAK